MEISFSHSLCFFLSSSLSIYVENIYEILKHIDANIVIIFMYFNIWSYFGDAIFNSVAER